MQTFEKRMIANGHQARYWLIVDSEDGNRIITFLPGRKELHPVITMKFSVRPGQGEASGFDLGDMVCSGELGEARSTGHTPDQGMMIYLSVPLLLDCLREWLRGQTKTLEFIGADTSFGLTFRKEKRHVSVASAAGPIGTASAQELAETVLRASEQLAVEALASLPADDSARPDYLAAMSAFRSFHEH
ncbi:hypothetical protein ACFYU9_16805 [Streptomyces sp. NPDC004327]|uniref:hypothetical protein n=1 Tax=Streptomyces sp. NPDC004327 TaxID=3364699 RepID=UPI0036C34A4A